MSICGGIAGRRGRSPKGIFIHNDAGGQFLDANYWANALAGGEHSLGNGFAHYYVDQNTIRQVEDDVNCAWHCGQEDSNMNYLSMEICQSMGLKDTFLANEERGLQLAAELCKKYGITPNESTIRLHQEVFATACPHRSVELHGGPKACKEYFIRRIKELMNNVNETQKQGANGRREVTMMCLYTIDGKGPVIFFDGKEFHPLSHPDEVTILNKIYKDNNGKDLPCYSWSSKAPRYARLQAAVKRPHK